MEKLSKTMQKRYDALEKRVTDIFNGACGEGMTTDEWQENWVTLPQASSIMRAIDKTWGAALKLVVFESFKIEYYHCEHFERPRQAAEWLWTLGIRK